MCKMNIVIGVSIQKFILNLFCLLKKCVLPDKVLEKLHSASEILD